MYALRIAVPVHWWFLSRPEDLAFISVLLLEDCVFEVGFFPYIGRSSVARDVSGNDVVVGRRWGVFIKRNDGTREHDDLDYA